MVSKFAKVFADSPGDLPGSGFGAICDCSHINIIPY